MRPTPTRRAVLKAIAGSAAASGTPAHAQKPVTGAGNAAAWSFDGVTGPEHWSELSPDYAACQFGIEQSPIDIVDAVKVNSAHALKLDYRTVTATVLNEGWTARLSFEPGSGTIINGDSFTLNSMLLRHPSEHLLSGRALELELQFIHERPTGGHAVMAVFVRQGRKSHAIEHIMARIPANSGEKSTGFALDPLELLPALPEDVEMRPYYRYMGSMTTPPCAEGVIWTVFKAPIEASARQIRDLSAMFPTNARPAHKINRRYLLEYSA